MTDQPSAAYRAMLAAMDAVLDEGLQAILRGMQAKHQAWHQADGDAPQQGTGCHTCELLGMAPAAD